MTLLRKCVFNAREGVEPEIDRSIGVGRDSALLFSNTQCDDDELQVSKLAAVVFRMTFFRNLLGCGVYWDQMERN